MYNYVFTDLHTIFYEVKLCFFIIRSNTNTKESHFCDEEVEVWDEYDLSRYLYIPEDTHRALHGRLGSRRALKIALIEEYFSNHPYPRWEPLIELVQNMERDGMARSGLAQEIKDKYINDMWSLHKPTLLKPLSYMYSVCILYTSKCL